jgi:hypothetical protein
MEGQPKNIVADFINKASHRQLCELSILLSQQANSDLTNIIERLDYIANLTLLVE